MVGCRRPAPWTVVEHHYLGEVPEQAVDAAIEQPDVLWLVLACGQGEVHGKDGEGVDEQFQSAVEHFCHLSVIPVLRA